MLPRAQRALGQRECIAERARGDAVLGVEPIERADELVLDGALPDGHAALREQPRGDGEQRGK